MCSADRQPVKICLEGDWTMNGVAGQHQQIMQWPEQLRAVWEQHEPTELDLSGITELDACGCQLLVTFARDLVKQGGILACSSIPASIGSKLQRLGFERCFEKLYRSGEHA